jgi:transcriptional regulator with XRE-family HTH domain
MNKDADIQRYENLKKIAKAKGYDMKELCKKIAMTPEGLKLAFTNDTIKLKTVISISEILGVSLDDLINKDISLNDNADIKNEKKKVEKCDWELMIYNLTQSVQGCLDQSRDTMRILTELLQITYKRTERYHPGKKAKAG